MQRYIPAILAFFFLIVSSSYAQNTQSETISVYLDCRGGGCNEQFIQTEISYVNFVRDQSDAEVFLFITSQQTGSGGREYDLEFIGQGAFENENRNLTLYTLESDTDEEQRNQLVRYIKLGLVLYLTEKDVLSKLNLNYENNGNTSTRSATETDPWNSWIFEIGGNTNFSGEESQKSFNLNGNLEANRITEEWKIELSYWNNYNRRTFKRTEEEVISPGDTVEVKVTDVFTRVNQNFFGLVAKSLGDHWSAGFYTRVRSSTQDNINLMYGITPSIEYSFFPYEEFTRREVTVRYGLFASQNNYSETTIFGKDEEFLIRQELRINSEFTQTWGGFDASIDARTYLHDLSKNRLRFDARINMRIVRGLSVYLSGRYSIINDQLSLSAEDTTDEELLLNLRSQATSYNFGGSIGLEFTFGSIYNNVINPRL